MKQFLNYRFSLLLVFVVFHSYIYSQETDDDAKKLIVSGYISNLGQSVVAKDTADNYKANWDYILHNRINMAWYATNNLEFHFQFRNQFLWGQSIKLNSNYTKLFEQDKGWLDMNFNWFSGQNYFLNTQIDRAYIQYYAGNFEFSVGRQRINWGRTLVWNPNDIFNAFSYYDFDYTERLGSDAIRAKYYMGAASEIELVAKVDSANELTLAAMYKFNKWGYDIQFIGGYANGQDYLLGLGFEGNIKQFALRGEATYYHPEDNFGDTTGVFLAALGTDVSIGDKFMLQAEFLYNDKKTISKSISDFSQAPANSKSLSFSEYNYFLNARYQVSPIITTYVAAMYYPDYKGFFLMPGIDVSLSDNMNFSILYQYFNLGIFNPLKNKDERIDINMIFGRLKWNF